MVSISVEQIGLVPKFWGKLSYAALNPLYSVDIPFPKQNNFTSGSPYTDRELGLVRWAHVKDQGLAIASKQHESYIVGHGFY